MDFQKWAVVCEHIVRHYNEGWADGYHLNIKYWEIWNEPDLGSEDPATSKTWGGTKEQFYDMVAEIKAENKPDDVYSLCGVDKDGKVLSILCYYTNTEDTAENKSVQVDLGKDGKFEIYLLDENHTNELVATTSDLSFDMTPNSCILIKEI